MGIEKYNTRGISIFEVVLRFVMDRRKGLVMSELYGNILHTEGGSSPANERN